MTTKTPTAEFEVLLSEYPEDSRIEKLYNYAVKLERLAEVTAQFKESLEDGYATLSEQKYAFSKVGEVYEEYEMYVDNFTK